MLDYAKNTSFRYSVLTDASNHGEIKTFPIIIRFAQRGKVYTFLIDIKNLEGETAEMISDMIWEVLMDEKIELDVINFYCFASDNTNTNFGGIAQKVFFDYFMLKVVL